MWINQTGVKIGVFVLQSPGGQHRWEQGEPEAHAYWSMERFTQPSRQEAAGELSRRAEERGEHVLVQCSYTGQCQPLWYCSFTIRNTFAYLMNWKTTNDSLMNSF